MSTTLATPSRGAQAARHVRSFLDRRALLMPTASVSIPRAVRRSTSATAATAVAAMTNANGMKSR